MSSISFIPPMGELIDLNRIEFDSIPEDTKVAVVIGYNHIEVGTISFYNSEGILIKRENGYAKYAQSFFSAMRIAFI